MDERGGRFSGWNTTRAGMKGMLSGISEAAHAVCLAAHRRHPLRGSLNRITETRTWERLNGDVI